MQSLRLVALLLSAMSVERQPRQPRFRLAPGLSERREKRRQHRQNKKHNRRGNP